MPDKAENWMEVLRKARTVVPFRPLTIVLNSGDRYRVSHPEALVLLHEWVIIELPTDKVGFTYFPPESIVAVETDRHRRRG